MRGLVPWENIMQVSFGKFEPKYSWGIFVSSHVIDFPPESFFYPTHLVVCILTPVEAMIYGLYGYKNATITYKSWYFMVVKKRPHHADGGTTSWRFYEKTYAKIAMDSGFFWSSAGCSGSVQTAEQGGWAKNGLNIHPAGERSAPGNPTEKTQNRLTDHDSTGVPTHDSMYIQLNKLI